MFAVTLMVVAVGVYVWRSMGDRSHTPIIPPQEFHFLCTKCDAGWETDAKEASKLFGGLPNYVHAIDCPKCQAEKSAFAKTPCPWCDDYYLPKYLIPDGPKNPKVDICSQCGKDTFKWKP